MDVAVGSSPKEMTLIAVMVINKYYMTCTLCQEKRQISSKCARMMYAYSIESTQSENVSVGNFSKIDIALYCSDCKQTECFFCGSEHGGK